MSKSVAISAQRNHVVRTAAGGRVLQQTLADPSIAPRVDAFAKRIAGSKAESVQFLQKVGILNRSGKLSKNFGG